MVESMKIPQNIKSFNPDEFDFNDIDKVKALFLYTHRPSLGGAS